MNGTRISELDGLRGIAAVGVAFYHIHKDGTFWMWSFVDLFFVLSGFLITGILLRLDGWSKENLRNFWMRRILRIWPVYYLTLFGVLALWWIKVLMDGEPLSYFAGFRESLVFLQYLVGDYDDLAPGVNYLYFFGHSWSLAVEEQFYLLWPLILWMFRRHVPVLLGFLVVFELVIFYYRSLGHLPDYLLVSRADGLVMGSVLAVICDERGKRWFGAVPAAVTAVVPLLLLAVAWWGLWPYFAAGYLRGGDLPDRSAFIFYFALAYVAIVALLLGGRAPWLNALLRVRPLVYLGAISYAVYMFHLPVQETLDNFHKRGLVPQRWQVELIFWVVTLSLAALSRVFIERRFEKLKKHFPIRFRQQSEPDFVGIQGRAQES